MPDTDADEQQSARLLTALMWAAVGLAPVAVLVALLGGGDRSLRFAVLLLAICVVLIGAALLIRNDPVLLRIDAQDRLAEEAEALRQEMREEISAAVRAASIQAPRPMTPPPMTPPPMSGAAQVPALTATSVRPVSASPAAQPGRRPPSATAQVPRPAAASAQVPRPAAANAQVPRAVGSSAQVPRPGSAPAGVPQQRAAGSTELQSGHLRPGQPQAGQPRSGQPQPPPGQGRPVPGHGQPAAPPAGRRGAAAAPVARAAVRPPDSGAALTANAAPSGRYQAEPQADEEPVVRSRRGRRSANRAAAPDEHLDASPSAWLAEPDDGWAEPAYDDPPPRPHPADAGYPDQDTPAPHSRYAGNEPDLYGAPAESDFYGAAHPDPYPAPPDRYGTHADVDPYGPADPDLYPDPHVAHYAAAEHDEYDPDGYAPADPDGYGPPPQGGQYGGPPQAAPRGRRGPPPGPGHSAGPDRSRW